MSSRISPDQKGQVACLEFDAECTRRGLISSVPVTHARYDRVVDFGGGDLKRVQVKWMDGLPRKGTEGSVGVSLQGSRNGKKTFDGYSRDEIDAIVAYVPSRDVLLWFNPEVFEGKTALAVRFEASKNNQQKRVLWWEDFVWRE